MGNNKNENVVSEAYNFAFAMPLGRSPRPISAYFGAPPPPLIFLLVLVLVLEFGDPFPILPAKTKPIQAYAS